MELLSPAGRWESMEAAVQNGADAVYLGCGPFNARRGAENFTPEQLPEAVRYCHLRGAKVYLTVNTLLSDRELPQAEELLRLASRCGVDGVIVQDWGLAALARTAVPDLPLHGSTQMTVHTLAGVEEAARLGMRCVVLGRELSREDAALIFRNSPVAVEVFVHGALCMCWSGQCAMSALIGRRSGNRGACAQPCRLPYRFDGGKPGHPLSLKDASLADHLEELREMGASILKLEGRMKRPEYVAVVTRIYAALLKEKRKPTPEERRQLALAFSREGYTDGYWRGRPGPDMFGSRGEDAASPEELFREAKAAYGRGDLRTVPAAMSVRLWAGEPARLTVSDDRGNTAAVEGPVPEAARSRPLEAEEVRARLSKTGGTVFRAEKVEVSLEPGLSLPASAVNALRREGLEALAALRTAPPERREAAAPDLPEDCRSYGEAPGLTVTALHPEQLTAELAKLAPDIAYLPVERAGEFCTAAFRDRGVELCALLPRVCTDREMPGLLSLLEKAREIGCTSLAVQNLGQIVLGEQTGLAMRGGPGLNVFNSRSLAQCRDWGLASAALSFELRYEQIRDLKKPLDCEAAVYGRLPLMITENCLISNAGRGCPVRQGRASPCAAVHTLTDRRGEDFPVLPAFGCRSEIENGKVLYLADKPEYQTCGLRWANLRFTTEPPEECARIVRLYRGEAGDPPEDYTRGLFYRGVE